MHLALIPKYRDHSTVLFTMSVMNLCHLDWSVYIFIAITQQYPTLYSKTCSYLGNRVVHINSRNFEFALLQHLVEFMNPSGGLLRKTLNS